MKSRLSRRALLIGGLSAGGIVLASSRSVIAGGFDRLYRASESLTLATHRLLLARNPLAREFDVSEISKTFPAIGTVMPEDEEYQRLRVGGFADWRLTIGGRVARNVSLSLAQLREMPARTQITAHSCERGWTAIAQWTGPQLAHVLALAGPLPDARYAAVHCVDGWYDCYRLDAFEALHPQTILAYGMNGRDLPIRHGAPVRLRVERQLGWKSLKFVKHLQLIQRLDQVGRGTGSYVADEGFQWYGGI